MSNGEQASSEGDKPTGDLGKLIGQIPGLVGRVPGLEPVLAEDKSHDSLRGAVLAEVYRDVAGYCLPPKFDRDTRPTGYRATIVAHMLEELNDRAEIESMRCAELGIPESPLLLAGDLLQAGDFTIRITPPSPKASDAIPNQFAGHVNSLHEGKRMGAFRPPSPTHFRPLRNPASDTF